MGKIRAAVIGVGYLGRFHAQKYAPRRHATSSAWSTARKVRERSPASRYAAAVADYRELLGHVDAVSVVTPTPLHFEIAAAFLEAGAHVLVEKPITETPDQARALIELAAQARGSAGRPSGAVQRRASRGRPHRERPALHRMHRLAPSSSAAPM